MAKHKKQPVYELDDEFIAQLDFLRNDYDRAQEELKEIHKDVHQLMGILVQNNIPIPKDLVERYIRTASDDGTEDLPFN